jgi:hypothetical protein
VTWEVLRISRPGDPHERRAAEVGRAAARVWPGQAPSPAGPADRLPDDLRAHFGRHLRHRFDLVRVHHDAAADRVTRRLSASAVTVGNDIYFRSGSYAPGTRDGLSLIGHELAHVQQQARAGHRLDRKVFTEDELEDMSPPATQPGLGLPGSDPAFEKFAAVLRDRHGARSVLRGTFSEQAAQVASRQVSLPAGVSRGALDQAAWKEWSPPSGWATYRMILQGIKSFAQGFGGLPDLSTVVLYNVYYDMDEKTGLVRPNPNVGAQYGGGTLEIYTAVVKPDSRPAGRSGVPYPGRKAELVTDPSERAAVRRKMEHELGHGVAEAAVGPGKQGPDPQMLDDYRQAAGWTRYRPATATSPGAPERLYDAGVPEVRAALQAGTDPPAQYHITKPYWNDGSWIEQPVTQYSTENPGEDFAEAIMAFLEFPEVLKARSPRRFAFIEARKAKWLPKHEASPSAHPAPGDQGTINAPPGGPPSP